MESMTVLLTLVVGLCTIALVLCGLWGTRLAVEYLLHFCTGKWNLLLSIAGGSLLHV